MSRMILLHEIVRGGTISHPDGLQETIPDRSNSFGLQSDAIVAVIARHDGYTQIKTLSVNIDIEESVEEVVSQMNAGEPINTIYVSDKCYPISKEVEVGAVDVARARSMADDLYKDVIELRYYYPNIELTTRIKLVARSVTELQAVLDGHQ